MSTLLEKIYYTAMRKYDMKLIAGTAGLWNSVSWIHTVEDAQVAEFLKGQELVIITGIKSPTKEGLLNLVTKIYENEASGIIFDVGPFIQEISEEIIQFAEDKGMPLFTLPWQIRLVEFNHEFCNLIIQGEQEDHTLCSAYKRAIFSPKEEKDYLPILINEGISINESYCMIKCMSKIDTGGGEKLDFTRIFYDLRQHFERIMNRTQHKFVIFRYDNYITTIVPQAEKEEVCKIVKAYTDFSKWRSVKGRMYFAVTKNDLHISDLSERFATLSYMCKINEKMEREVWYWEELGEWEMIFSVKDISALSDYRKNTIGLIEKYDYENHSDYCKILDAYLRLDGNMQAVAAECFIHRNTVAYHLKKIQEILNCDIYSMKDRVRLYMALRIKEIQEL